MPKIRLAMSISPSLIGDYGDSQLFKREEVASYANKLQLGFPAVFMRDLLHFEQIAGADHLTQVVEQFEHGERPPRASSHRAR
jgi:hypothetical protein